MPQPTLVISAQYIHELVVDCLQRQAQLETDPTNDEWGLVLRLAATLNDPSLLATGLLSTSTRRALQDAVDTAALSDAEASRAVLRAVERHPRLASVIENDWRRDLEDRDALDDHTLDVLDGTVIATGAFNPKDAFGDQQVVPPRWALPATPTEGGFMRLVNLPRGIAATIRWADGGTDPDLTFTTLHPCADANDEIHPGEVDEDSQTFFGVRPVDPDSALQTTLGLLGDVDSGIVVLPELHVTVDTQDSLLDAAGHLDVLVAGSAHTPDGTNASRVLIRGLAEPLAVTKAVPFEFQLNGHSVRERLEATARRTLDVVAFKHVRIAVLICRDALDERTIDSLIALGVRVLLVPAMTPDLEPFRDVAQQLATRRQGITVVANGPQVSFDGTRPGVALLSSGLAADQPAMLVDRDVPANVHWAPGNPPN